MMKNIFKKIAQLWDCYILRLHDWTSRSMGGEPISDDEIEKLGLVNAFCDHTRMYCRHCKKESQVSRKYQLDLKIKLGRAAMIIAAVLFLASCEEPIKYAHVTSITATTQTMMVTHTTTHDNRLSRTAGGAAIGYIIGGKLKHGIIGGGIGAATSDDPKTESYTKMETETTYKIHFSNGDSISRTNYCSFRVGDSIPSTQTRY